jgi:hypothetical protein
MQILDSVVTLLPRACRVAVVLGGAVGVAACVAPGSPPRVVDTTEPTVTYQYAADADLIQVTQNAEAFCSGFQAWPKTRTLVDNADGTKTVVFECERTPPPPLPAPIAMVTPAPQPGVSYKVSSDLELVNALRNANAYCRQRAMQADAMTVGQNVDGTRTVTFRCVTA